MKRAALALMLGAVAIAVAGCSAGDEPDPIPVPTGIDWEAAARLQTDGNGVWLRSGNAAMREVLDATRDADRLAATLTVHERVPIEGGSLPGRDISVDWRSSGADYEAQFSIGDVRGEVVAVEQEMWIRGNAALLASHGLDDRGTFQCVSPTSPASQALLDLITPVEMLATSATGLTIGTMPPERPGEPATLTLGTEAAPIGRILVESHGAPVPHDLRVADESGSIRIEFDWSTTEVVSPPDEATCS